jgi:hypothetical protein
MSTATRYRLLALAMLLGCLPAGYVGAQERDTLRDARDRLAIEAQRVEQRFKDGRAAAYQMVRTNPAKYVEAVEELQVLLVMLRSDTSLSRARREQLINTIKFDEGNLKKIAAEARRKTRSEDVPSRTVRSDVRSEVRRSSSARSTEDRSRLTREAESILESRGRYVADARDRRRISGERRVGALRSVEESGVLPASDYEFPPRDKWLELTKKRSPASKMTAKERALLRTLSSVINVDFKENTLSQVIDWLEKATGQTIIVDKRALEEVGVTYDTPITLKTKSTVRTVLKRILADLNLAYVVKDEVIQVTSIARAKEMVTTRTYYLGDLVAVTDFRFGPILSQLQMLQNVQQLIALITKNIEPQSWRVNNPDALGEIIFHPATMSLVVKQTAEVHFSLSGGR